MNYMNAINNSQDYLESMKKSFLKSKEYLKNKNNNYKSVHWNNFLPENYEVIFSNNDYWNNFLRNAISIGCNDVLAFYLQDKNISPHKFKKSKFKNKDFSEIIFQSKHSSTEEKELINLATAVINYVGTDFFFANQMSNIGNPRFLKINAECNKKIENLRANKHDMCDIYHYKLFKENILDKINTDNLIIAEIGAGYGGFASKVIRNKQLKYVIFDLPEVNALQYYYLSKNFPEKIIVDYDTFVRNGRDLNQKFDILILPPWEIESFKKDFFNIFVNIRSMQEMNKSTIKFYFQNIQNNIRNGGLFFNLNRYQKPIGKEIIKFEEFPYDCKWSTSFYQKSQLQDCHILITKRVKNKKTFILENEIKLSENNTHTTESKLKEIDIQNKIINDNLLQLMKLGRNVDVKSFEKNYQIEDINDPTLLYIFGTNRLLLNEYYEAKLYLKKSVKLNNNFCEAFANLAVIFDNEEDYDNALFYYDRALEINPSHSTTIINQSHIYNKKLQSEKVIENLLKLPKSLYDIEVCNLFSKNYFRLNDFKNALYFSEKALKKDPENIVALNNLGRAYLNYEVNNKTKKIDYLNKALKCFKKVFIIDPSSIEALYNIGTAYEKLSNEKKAEEYYRKVLNINPDYKDASINLALILLRKGEFSEGWQRYEDRLLMDNPERKKIIGPNTSLPFWSLDCKDSKLFVWPEQGIGDTIFYSSLLNELNEKCSSITCVIEPRLNKLYKRSFPNINFGKPGDEYQEDDFTHQLAIGSIPKFFRNNLEDFSKSPYAYLKADLNRSLKIQDEIKNKNDFTVGISWTSQGSQKDFKSVDINLIINCLKKLPVKIVNLQYGEVDEEISMVKKQHNIDILQCPSVDIYNDFDGLASLMAACDVVLTTPNVNQTIASALGVPTFLLLSDDPSFRWLNKGMDSIWHPNTKLFRQDKNGDWTQAFNQVSQIIFNLYVQSFQNDIETIKQNVED